MFDKLGFLPQRKSKCLATSKVDVQLDPLFPTMKMVGAEMRCSSVVDKNIAKPTDFILLW